MKSDDRAAALVALVEADSEARTRAVTEPAARQAREMLRTARRNARLRVATAIAEERGTYSLRTGAAEARLATARRMVEQRRLKALVAEGWERLAPALLARWNREAERREWIDAAIARATDLLPCATWQVDGPAGWPEAERAHLESELRECGIDAQVGTDAAIEAGLRIASGNIELDATLAGLLADRFAIEGRLLHWHTARPKGSA